MKVEKKYKKDEGTVIAYHRYVQSIISDKLNSFSLGPGFIPCRIAAVLLPISLVFLTIGLFIIFLRPHHLYLVGVWPRFLGPFFIMMFIACFGGSVFFWDRAIKKSNKFRRHLKFRPYGLYGTKVLHESEVEREKQLRSSDKSGTAPHKSTRSHHRQQRYGYPERRGANDEGYDRSGETRADRPPRAMGPSEKRVFRDHPYSDSPPPKYRERDEPSRDRPYESRPRRNEGPPERRPQDYTDRGRREEPRWPRNGDYEMARRDDYGERRVHERAVESHPRDEYASVNKERGKPQYADPQQQRKQSASRYDAPPERFYDEVPIEVQPSDVHHVVSRRTAQPTPRYSERNVDEHSPMVVPGHPQRRYEIQFDTDAQDSAV